MKLKLFPRLTTFSAEYEPVHHCPLCGSDGIPQARLTRDAYRFGLIRIPLPEGGVSLIECLSCDLLWKSQIPTAQSISAVMTAAPAEWERKPGHHPRLPALFDIARHELRHGEYILGLFESELWCDVTYSTVTAHDMFSCFTNAAVAMRNMLRFVRPDGRLIVETGDWRSVTNLGDWYYANRFDHQIFWSEAAIRYLANLADLAIERYEQVNHRGRQHNSRLKDAALHALRALGPVAKVFGVDAHLVPPPTLKDHLFTVLRKQVTADAVAVGA